MKKIALLALVVAAAVIGYNQFVNVKPASAEDRALADLEERFDRAEDRMIAAGRSAGMAGIDATADISAAQAEIRRVGEDLGKLKDRITGEASRSRAAALERRIRAALGG